MAVPPKLCTGQSWSWIPPDKVILLIFSNFIRKKSSYLFENFVLLVFELDFIVNLSHEVYPLVEIPFMAQRLESSSYVGTTIFCGTKCETAKIITALLGFKE